MKHVCKQREIKYHNGVSISKMYPFSDSGFVIRARWRENRTIFNTPNPRLMNVSLLRENKLLHTDRRGSRSSARGPSRQPSMASLRAHSPNSQGIFSSFSSSLFKIFKSRKLPHLKFEIFTVG